MSDLELIPEIDPDHLDVEWLQQPHLFEAFSIRLAEVEAKRDLLVEERKTLRSRLLIEGRQGGEDLIGCKPTEAAVEAWYRQQLDWVDISVRCVEAEKAAKIAKSQIFAMSQRRTALEHLVSLYRGHYFSGPTLPASLTESVGEFGRDVDDFRGSLLREEVDDSLAQRPSPASKPTKKKARRKCKA